MRIHRAVTGTGFVPSSFIGYDEGAARPHSMSAEPQAGNSTRIDTKRSTEFLGATPPIVLSIAGFDPSSGAGITADLKVFSAHRLYGMSCITALTVQSTLGVREVEPVSSQLVAETLQTLTEDVTFAGIKIGMLATAEICEIVSAFLDRNPAVPVVLDPVLRSSSGRQLLESAGVRAIQETLLYRVNWITPNLAELGILTGESVEHKENIPRAADSLRRMARNLGNEGLNIVVTGGHLDRPDDYLLTCQGESSWIPGQRVETSATHGTGCAFSSSLLCRIVARDSPLAAVTSAKAYVAAALNSAYPIGRGNGPMHHLFGFDV